MANLELILQLRDEASAQLQQINSEIKASADSWKSKYSAIEGSLKSAAMAFTAFGGSIMGALGMAYKAFEEDEQSLKKLTNTLKNAGVEYSSVQDEIEGVTEAMYENAGIGDGEQYNALNKLILITGDYQKSISLLPTVFNLAAAANMDAEQAAILMGRVLEGDVNILHRYLGAMDGATTATQALDWMNKNLANSAAEALSPLDKLNAAWNRLVETIGKSISGEGTSIISGLVNALNSITKWAKDNPDTLNFIVTALASIGGAAAGLGLAAGGAWAFSAALAALSGPVGWVLLAIELIIAAGILLILNWDWVKEHWRQIWLVIGLVLAGFLGPIGFGIAYLASLAMTLIEHWDSARGFWENIWNSIKIITLNAVNDLITIINPLLNWLIDRINSILDLINNMGKIAGKDWNLHIDNVEIPKLTEEMMGIFSNPNPGGGFIGPELLTSGSLPVTFMDQFGNYGKLGETTIVNMGGVTITIEGGGMDSQEIAEAVRQEILKLQMRNANSSGITP